MKHEILKDLFYYFKLCVYMYVHRNSVPTWLEVSDSPWTGVTGNFELYKMGAGVKLVSSARAECTLNH